VPEADTHDANVEKEISEFFKDYSEHLAGCDFKKSIQDVMALAHFGNEYFNSCTPWKLI
jgi:methionyl-tRNA synthetase